ncbi:MAG: hypothetical protein Q9199_002785 [Rusavskia elegans]
MYAPSKLCKIPLNWSFPSSIAALPPRPPPGLRLPLIWDPDDHEFEPKELWLHLVACQSVLASYGEYQRMLDKDVFPLVISKGAIVVQPMERATYGVMVWALLVIGVQMAQRYPMPQAIPTLSTTVSAHGVLRGHIRIQKPVLGVAPVATSEKAGSDHSTSMKARRRNGSDLSLLTADTGSKPCFEDPNLVVHYRFTKRPLSPGQVFTAFLNGNVFCSDHEEESYRDVSVVAFSSDRLVSMRLKGVEFGSGVKQLSWRLARIALRELWQGVVMAFIYDRGGFVDEPRWESVSFLLFYGGVRIGQGSLG